MRAILQLVSAQSSHIPFSFFFKKSHFIDKTNPNALRRLPLTTSDRVSLYVNVSENTLPFESQSISNFSEIDISQSVGWERPSLSAHFLLPHIHHCCRLQVILITLT